MSLLQKHIMQKPAFLLTWVDMISTQMSGVVPFTRIDLLSAPVSAPSLLFPRRAAFHFRPLVSLWPLDRLHEPMESEE